MLSGKEYTALLVVMVEVVVVVLAKMRTQRNIENTDETKRIKWAHNLIGRRLGLHPGRPGSSPGGSITKGPVARRSSHRLITDWCEFDSHRAQHGEVTELADGAGLENRCA